mmetsp:Transcript_70691/g.165778  ORF Transcript_70691/g.165778 Transcript_70691/m.165778 type:complete len:252 (+) Transcript_70691:696-1451(+)
MVLSEKQGKHREMPSISEQSELSQHHYGAQKARSIAQTPQGAGANMPEPKSQQSPSRFGESCLRSWATRGHGQASITQKACSRSVISLLQVLKKNAALDVAVETARCPPRLQGSRFERPVQFSEPCQRRRWMQRRVPDTRLQAPALTSRRASWLGFGVHRAQGPRGARGAAAAGPGAPELTVKGLATVGHITELGEGQSLNLLLGIFHFYMGEFRADLRQCVLQVEESAQTNFVLQHGVCVQVLQQGSWLR